MREENWLYKPSAFTHPPGYFYAQLALAEKAVQIGAASDLVDGATKFTSIPKRIKKSENDPRWEQWKTDVLSGHRTTMDLTYFTWQAFACEANLYKPKGDDNNHFGAFIGKIALNRENGEQEAQLHFNVHRGSKEYSRNNADGLRNDLTHFTRALHDKLNGTDVRITLGSWMNKIPGIRAVLPEAFVQNEEVLKYPKLSLNGDSSMGQMVRNDGGAKPEMVEAILANVRKVQNLEELTGVLPCPTTLFVGRTAMFYQEFGI